MLHVAFGISLTLCPVYDSSTGILLFIDEHIFIKNFLKTHQIQWISFLHNPFGIIPNKMILKNMIVCSFETLQYLKLISLHNKVWPNPSNFSSRIPFEAMKFKGQIKKNKNKLS